MRDAARALDDVSDHLGEVLRHADELLVEWSRFGARVRTSVDAEVAGIGEVVDGAVLRAANSGVDRAIADRLRALSSEIERLEQRTRAASRAVADQRAGDRRLLWSVIAGVVLSNALLVVLLLRRPEPVPLPAPEPVRVEASPAPSPAPPEPAVVPDAGSAAGSAELPAAPNADEAAGSAARPGNAKPGAEPGERKPSAAPPAATKPAASGVALPRPVGAHAHKKW